MLIISRDLVLSQPDVVSDGVPLIGWQSLVTVGNVTATSADALYPVTNLANPSTVLPWLATSTAVQYVTVEFSSAVTVDYVGLARHNFASAGIAVSVEARYAGVWQEIAAPYAPADGRPILFRFLETAPEAVRVKLTAGTAAPTLAVLYVGKLLVMPRGVNIDTPHTPLNFGRVTEAVQGRSEAGDYLGTIVVGRYSKSTEQFSHLPADWYRGYFDPFVKFAAEDPFFYAWRPVYPLEIGFAKLTSDPEPSLNPKTNRFSVQLHMRGVLQ